MQYSLCIFALGHSEVVVRSPTIVFHLQENKVYINIDEGFMFILKQIFIYTYLYWTLAYHLEKIPYVERGNEDVVVLDDFAGLDSLLELL